MEPGGPTRFCTWSIIARACTSSSCSPRPGCWATATSSCSTSASAPCWATTAGRSRPARATPWAWKGCWTKRSAARRRSSPTTTTPSPTGRSFRPSSADEIAETVGIAAIKYADLSQNRTSDYVFSYDKMLAMNGNTATYMQYAYARVRSIFARGNVDIEALRRSGAAIVLDSPAERALGLELLRFAEALDLRAGRLSAQPTDVLPVRPGQSLLDVLRAMPRAEGRERAASPKPPAAVRPDRPDDPEGAGVAGDRRGREDVGSW